MTIETKYNLYQKVWVMEDGSPRELRIRGIEGRVDSWWTFPKEIKTTASYFLASGNTAFCHHEWYAESRIFPTKEELLKSL